MGQRGDLPGAAHHGKLFRGFKQAHLMHNGPPVDNRVRRLQILARAFAQFFEGVEHNLIGIGIFTPGEVDRVQTVEQLIQLLVDFAERQRPVDAKLRRRGLWPRRRPNQISAVRSRTRLNSTLWLWVSSLLINTSSASGSLKPVKYQKSLFCR